MKVQVKALQPFTHGNVSFDPRSPDTYQLNKLEAQELEKKGMVQVVGEGEAEEKAAAPVDSKMAPAPENKMMPTAQNKTDAETEPAPKAAVKSKPTK